MKINNKLKVVTVFGTRPEIIRLSSVMGLLDKYTNHKMIHTGQNYDFELSQIFFDDLNVRRPDYFLDIDTSSLGSALGEILIKIEKILLIERPDAFLVLGDTNSAISLLMAKRMKIPSYHMEAGNRSFDSNVPEEVNRKMVDHISDFNLVYTEHARRNLISEGLHSRYIYLTGSPMYEVLNKHKQNIDNSNILENLNIDKHKYFIVSIHREENVDSASNLKKIIKCLKDLRNEYKLPIIVSTHPRTKLRIEKMGLLEKIEGVEFLKPFGFYDYNKLQLNSLCAISDSGTISEESLMLDCPAVSLRNSIERPEALDSGGIILTGLESETLLQAVNMVIDERDISSTKKIPGEYQIDNTSIRVVKLIIGTAKLANKWMNLDEFSRYDWELNS